LYNPKLWFCFVFFDDDSENVVRRATRAR